MTTTQHGLSIQATLADGRQWTGSLVQFNGGTLTAQFWGADLPSMGLGQPMELAIGGLEVELPSLQGRALERVELPGGRSYRFGYVLTAEFLSCIPKPLQVLFPYRATHRVQPTEEAPATARVRCVGQSEWSEAVVLDLSTAGMGLAVQQEVEARLDSDAAIEVELSFPQGPQEGPWVLNAQVQHRRMKGVLVRYGVAFTASPEGDGPAQAALEAYVLQQERKLP